MCDTFPTYCTLHTTDRWCAIAATQFMQIDQQAPLNSAARVYHHVTCLYSVRSACVPTCAYTNPAQALYTISAERYMMWRPKTIPLKTQHVRDICARPPTRLVWKCMCIYYDVVARDVRCVSPQTQHEFMHFWVSRICYAIILRKQHHMQCESAKRFTLHTSECLYALHAQICFD